MSRRTRKLTGADGLHWTVKRLVLPTGMRPLSRFDVLDAATPRRMIVEGMSERVPDAIGAATGPLPLGFLFVPFALPFLPFVLLLRRLNLLPWTVEARTYPWGRRFPPTIHSYAVRGGSEAHRVLDELAEALLRGDGAPVIAGAERIREPHAVHGGSKPPPTFPGGRP